MKFAQVVGVFPGPKFDDAEGGCGSPAGKKFTMVVEWELKKGVQWDAYDVYTYLYHNIPYVSGSTSILRHQSSILYGSRCKARGHCTTELGISLRRPCCIHGHKRLRRSITMKVDHFPNAVS